MGVLDSPKIIDGPIDGGVSRKSAGVAQHHQANWPPANVSESCNMNISRVS